jgi:hypothetical protein
MAKRRKKILDNSVSALVASLTDQQRRALGSRQQLSITGPAALVSEGIKGGTVAALRRRGLIAEKLPHGHLQLTELGATVIGRLK